MDNDCRSSAQLQTCDSCVFPCLWELILSSSDEDSSHQSLLSLVSLSQFRVRCLSSTSFYGISISQATSSGRAVQSISFDVPVVVWVNNCIGQMSYSDTSLSTLCCLLRICDIVRPLSVECRMSSFWNWIGTPPSWIIIQTFRSWRFIDDKSQKQP